MNRRGLSPVLGLVLLVGITAIASMALFLVGMSLSASTQASAEYEQAERSMAQLAQSGDAIAVGESDRAEFDVQGSNSGTLRAMSDRGTINITVTNRSDDTRLFTMEKPLGVVVYEAADGTEIAYQGGGVWRKDPNGGSSLVRSPEFHYRTGEDPTITYPVVLVRDDVSSSGGLSGSLVETASDRHYPDRPDHYNPLKEGSVLIKIESEYCQGWEEYYRDRTDGSAAEGCDAGKEDQLVIQFSVPFEVNGLGNGVMIDDGNGNPDDFDKIDDSSDFGDSTESPSATPLVEEKLEEAKDSGRVLPDDDTIDDPGLYYDDGNLSDDDEDLVLDTSSGDIEIATDQPTVFNSQADVDIVGDNNVSVYATSNAVSSGGGSGEIGTYGKASQLRLFFHSDVDTIGDGGQNTDFHGLIYAPNAKVDLFSGNNNASGALVAEDYDFGNTEMEIDSDLQDIQLHETVGDAPFYYLHISETVIEVED